MSQIFLWFLTGPASHADESKASRDVMLGGDSQAVSTKDVAQDMTTLLPKSGYFSFFEGLIPRPLEPMGVPSLYPLVARHVISTMLSLLVVATEVLV